LKCIKKDYSSETNTRNLIYSAMFRLFLLFVSFHASFIKLLKLHFTDDDHSLLKILL